jgi:hypothetical protein
MPASKVSSVHLLNYPKSAAGPYRLFLIVRKKQHREGNLEEIGKKGKFVG